MANDLHRYGIMIHRKGHPYEDDPDHIDNILKDDNWWDELDPEVFQEWVFT